MGLGDVLGQEMAVKQLQGAVINKRISHAYLFAGPPGVGKFLAAKEMAKVLNCENQQLGDACELCPSCQKNNSNSHPQVHYIAPSGSTIKINQIRELQEKIKYKAFDGFYQIVVIEQADAITQQGANSILKTLEEPPPETVFILITNQAIGMMPTILSRCQLIRFTGLASQVLEQILLKRQVGSSQAKMAGALAKGNAALAIELCENEDLNYWRELAIEVADMLHAKNILQVLNKLDDIVYPKLPVVKLLDLLLLWYRDIIIWQETENRELLLNEDKLYLIKGDDNPIPQILDMIEQITRCKQEIESNTNEKAALESLLVQLAR